MDPLFPPSLPPSWFVTSPSGAALFSTLRTRNIILDYSLELQIARIRVVDDGEVVAAVAIQTQLEDPDPYRLIDAVEQRALQMGIVKRLVTPLSN